jgi:hypothetical protein
LAIFFFVLTLALEPVKESRLREHVRAREKEGDGVRNAAGFCLVYAAIQIRV